MRNHFTDKFDLMAETVERLKKILFENDCNDRDVVEQVSAILAEHEIVSDQIARRYA